MDLCCWVAAVIVAYVCIQVLRIIVGDCDLSLQWALKFGKNPATLKGKVVWITGASSGIGEFTAYELAAAGCRLVLSARRESELERVKKQCVLSGPIKEDDVLVLSLDLLKNDTHADCVKTVLNYFKKIDILVNNAGRSQRAAWDKITVDVHREMLELNVLGALSLTNAVLPHMMQNKNGHIVVMSSAAGKFGVPYSGSYTGSKYALHGFFESLRIEAYQNNIKVSMICPGPVFSNLLEVAFTDVKGEVVGRTMDPSEKRLSTSRCGYLTAVAIANALDEAWIALHPFLIFMYVSQYLPSVARVIACKMGTKQITKMREGY